MSFYCQKHGINYLEPKCPACEQNWAANFRVTEASAGEHIEVKPPWWASEIKVLQEKLAEATKDCIKLQEIIVAKDAELSKLREDHAEALRALEFYGDESTYNIFQIAHHIDGKHVGIMSPVHSDGGKLARQTLAKLKKESGE